MNHLHDDIRKRYEDELAKHYGEPVRPVSQYCEAFRQWAAAWTIKAAELRKTMCEHCDGTGKVSKYDQGWKSLAHSDKLAAKTERCLYCLETPGRRYDYAEAKRIAEAASVLQIPIAKSNLLHRLIYIGEPLRTKKCPEHQGRWSGCDWNFDEDKPVCECTSGLNITGWLP